MGMVQGKRWLKGLAAGATLALLGAPAGATEQTKKFTPNDPACKNTGQFERWLEDFRKEARSQGVSNATIANALGGMTLDPGIIARDRKQGFFAQTFTAFSGKLISQNRLNNGMSRLKQHREVLARVEEKYGVPGPIIVAFWALESDFGVGMGNLPVLRSLATLAYDCRRGDMFREELMAALKIIDRGDLTPADMIGSWAGELGQTQFLPTHYLAHAVDFDGDGRRNMMTSVPDVVASTGAFIQFLGWQRGQPWLQEVRVPQNLPWDQADLAIQHPRSKWTAMGVVPIDGKPLPPGDLPASLLLPMGRFGPAFLAYPNFQIYLKWNQSLNYAITAAHLAARLNGAPGMAKATAEIPELSPQQGRELQQLLTRRGFFSGEIDGKIGAETRAGVKKAQLQLGLPPDSYPTPELLERLRGR